MLIGQISPYTILSFIFLLNSNTYFVFSSSNGYDFIKKQQVPSDQGPNLQYSAPYTITTIRQKQQRNCKSYITTSKGFTIRLLKVTFHLELLLVIHRCVIACTSEKKSPERTISSPPSLTCFELVNDSMPSHMT